MFNFYSAYLNRELDKDIFMEQPPHYEMADQDCYIIKFYKTLYGLMQVEKKWYNSLCCSLADIGFNKTEADPAAFYVHVGNSTMTGSSVTLQQEFKARINTKFQLMNLGPISWLLGLAITCDHATCPLSLSQHAYINTLLCHFNLEDYKSLT